MSTYEPLLPSATRPSRPAVWPASSLVVAVGVLVGLDQAAKLWVEQTLPLRGALPLLGEGLRLVHVANRGAVGGVGGELPWAVPALSAAGAALILLLLGAYRLYDARLGTTWRGQAFLVFALGALFCTLIDRVRLGYVLDFVSVRGWPVFNLGDLLPGFAMVFLLLEAVSLVRRS